MNLSGKVAIVTGASRGIGREVAVALSRAGAAVILNYSKDDEGIAVTHSIIEENNGYSKIKKWDVSSYSECSKACKEIYDNFGKIDLLINNAGISHIGLFIDMKEEDWNKLIDVNIKGVFNMTQCALNYMLKCNGGNIINVSSIWGNVGASCESVYSATKGAINTFTKAMAKEMGPSNIRVNAVSPGVISTDMNKWISKEEKESICEEISLGRFGETSDVANTVLFLCSDHSKYITGQIITIDGGFV